MGGDEIRTITDWQKFKNCFYRARNSFINRSGTVGEAGEKGEHIETYEVEGATDERVIRSSD